MQAGIQRNPVLITLCKKLKLIYNHALGVARYSDIYQQLFNKKNTIKFYLKVILNTYFIFQG